MPRKGRFASKEEAKKLLRKLASLTLLLLTISCGSQGGGTSQTTTEEVHLQLFWGGDGDPACLDLLDADDVYECYLSALREQREYSNAVSLRLVLNGTEIISPFTELLQAYDEAGYDFIELWFPNEIWQLSEEDRAKVYEKLKEAEWFDKIAVINVVDEPYHPNNGWTIEELREGINEIKENFPDKKLKVNFAPNVTLPEYEIPDENLDYVSMDLYPWWFVDSDEDCQDEILWKSIINQRIQRLKDKTDKPIIYVAQGYTGYNCERYCQLTADNVNWSYEVANANELYGLAFYFPRKIRKWADYVEVGYREPGNEEPEQEIIRIGSEILAIEQSNKTYYSSNPLRYLKEELRKKPKSF